MDVLRARELLPRETILRRGNSDILCEAEVSCRSLTKAIVAVADTSRTKKVAESKVVVESLCSRKVTTLLFSLVQSQSSEFGRASDAMNQCVLLT